MNPPIDFTEIPVTFSKDWFNSPFYNLLYAHRNDLEAKIFANSFKKYIAMLPFGPFLDAGCGEGRFSFQLANLGLTGFGIDMACDKIETAKKNNPFTDRLQFVCGDYINYPWQIQFSLILSMFTAFGYLDDHHNQITLERFFELLLPNGIFVLDYLNALQVKQSIETHNAINVFKPSDFDNHLIKKLNIEFERIYTFKKIYGDAVMKKIVIFRKEKEKPTVFYEKVKLYDREDLLNKLTNKGFSIENIYGDYDFKSFQKNSPRLIIIAKK